MSIEDFIGIPFKHSGRDNNGLDCFGLVLVLYKEVLNIDLPDYRDYEKCWYEKGKSILSEQLNKFKSLWHEVGLNAIKPFDILTFNHGSNTTNHCSVYLGDDKMIHTYERVPVVIDRLSNKYWNNRIRSVMRYDG